MAGERHSVIAAAIAKGDPDAAQNAVETNWQNAADRLTHLIAQHGERGIWLHRKEDAEPQRAVAKRRAR